VAADVGQVQHQVARELPLDHEIPLLVVRHRTLRSGDRNPLAHERERTLRAAGSAGIRPGNGLVRNTVGAAVPPGAIHCTVFDDCDTLVVNTLPMAVPCSTESGT